MPRISTFIISMLVVSLFITGFMAFYTAGSTSYNVDNTENISGFDKYDKLYNLSKDVKDQVSNQTTSTGGFDTIGDFLSYGYNAVKISLGSIDIFNEMNEEAFNHITPSETIIRYKAIVFLIVFIIIIFVVIALLTNRNNL